MFRSLRWSILLIPFLVSTARAEPVELRWWLQKGQVLKYQLKHREVRTVEIGDQKRETVTTSEYSWQWTVREVDEQGTATLGHKFTALRIENAGTDFDYRYDSAQGNQSQDDYAKKLNHYYDQLRFGEYQVRLRPDGRIAGVTGFDKLLGEIGADQAVLDFHAWNLRDGSFAWFLQQALGVLPAKKVTPGDKWQLAVDNKLDGLGQVHGKTEYVLGKLGDDAGRATQTIQSSGSHTVEVDAKWLNSPLRGTLKTTKLAGTVRFDPATGAVRTGSAQIELAGELLFGNENNPAKMKITFQHTLEMEAKP